MSTVLVSTWSDGVTVLAGKARTHELPGHSVGALTPDGRGGALAIVEGYKVSRRDVAGTWTTLGNMAGLSCCVAVGDDIYVGTNDARILRLRANGDLEPLPGFDSVPGRETWYAGQALIDGRMMGPPLGIRSITATADGVLLANVHVGGIPRSHDRGATWQPTIAIDVDVHEVRAHPTRPEIVIAAAGAGLCTSRDGGATWIVSPEGLHAAYCSAVAFAGDDLLVAASADHFAPEGALYRRGVDAHDPPAKMSSGLPTWLGGIADTHCIAASGTTIVIADRASVYVSTDAGQVWSRVANDLPGPSSVLVV